jgi:plastocyanin
VENDDDTVHTVVALDGTFRSQALDTEDKFSFTFDRPGTFEYFCSLHPYMKAKVVVAP